MRWKVDFTQQPAIPAQWLDQEEARKHFPKPNLHQKMVIVTVWWSAAPLIHTAFWILVKPLHLKSMVRKSMRCTENCNACSQHWSTEMAQFFSRTTPDCTVAQPMLQRLNELDYKVLPHLSWFTGPRANQLPLLQASQQLFAGKMLQQPAGGRKSFPRVHWILKDFYATGISQLISHWRKCVDYNDSYFD